MTLFRVYHRQNHRFHLEYREDAHFIIVADVDAENLDQVFRLTNHIEDPWWVNEGVTVIGFPIHRSTSVGDEIENTATGERWAVASVGFVPVLPLA